VTSANVFDEMKIGGREVGEFHTNLGTRRRTATVGQLLFQAATIVGILALTALLYNVGNMAFGLVAVDNKVAPETLAVSGVPLTEQTSEQLVTLLQGQLSKGVLRRLESEKPLAERPRQELYQLVVDRVLEPTIVASWPLVDSVLHRSQIAAQVATDYPNGVLQFRSWVSLDFLREPQSATPAMAGVRTAVLGSLWTIAITIIIAFPMGVGAAVYLEEYAGDSVINRIIRTNISNLAGVPSIIYGILGLAIFVRVLEPLTGGTMFGVTDPTTANGRTIASAGLTLALLILPLIIINAEEAIRSVPGSLRLASYGLGATQWQTIWHHVLPSALPGVLTGTILAVSRAIGETAPLVVIGASTFIAFDPDSPFSKFTTLPIQIYQWTSRPQDQFRHIAAAAIIVLLGLLLTLNATAILMRNRYSAKVQQS
jgi:phosphate transport system permease protein